MIPRWGKALATQVLKFNPRDRLRNTVVWRRALTHLQELRAKGWLADHWARLHTDTCCDSLRQSTDRLAQLQRAPSSANGSLCLHTVSVQ